MTKLDAYGYSAGVVSNSMIQTAVTCLWKYKLTFIDKVDPYEGKDVFNAAWAGNVIHKCIELHDGDHDAIYNQIWLILEPYFGKAITDRSKSLMSIYKDARAKTMEDGLKWGREYKAPEMTGFWKKNYGGLDTLFEQLDQDVRADNRVFLEPYSELLKKIIVSLNNWKHLRIDTAVAAEIKFKYYYNDIDLGGTADRLEVHAGKGALCDLKTGKWAFSTDKINNLDQFGLYDMFLGFDNRRPDKWILYDLFANNTEIVMPNQEMRTRFLARLNTNLDYLKQAPTLLENGSFPVPAGSSNDIACTSCQYRKSGHCPFVYNGEG